jgi:hypothetical protein
MRNRKDSRSKTGQPPREKRAISDDEKEKRTEINPALKSFLNNCIVPILVKEYTETVLRERVRESKGPKP